MKKYLLTLLFIVGCTSKVILPPELIEVATIPQRCHGQDILGLARQNVQMIKNNWYPGECLGVLQSTFGNVIPNVKTIVEFVYVPAVRWHLSFCNHNNQCQPNECKPTDLKCIASKAKAINAFHADHPYTECYISPRLEYNERNCSLVNKWFNTVENAAPLCNLVASPLPGACVPKNVLIEKHGNNPGEADIVSNDGANIFDSDSVKYAKLGRVMNMKWTYRDNLRLSSEKGAALPPMKRPLSNRLGVQDLQQMQLLKFPLDPMPVPDFCAKFRSLKGGEVFKNHAEDYSIHGDSRSNKPLLIYSRKVANIPIFNSTGSKISCMKYYGPYEKLHRHYVGSCSGDHAMDLFEKAGHWIYIKEGNTCIGLPSIRRWGTFR